MKRKRRRLVGLMFVAGLMCAFLAGCAVEEQTQQRDETGSEVSAGGNNAGLSDMEISGEITPVEPESVDTEVSEKDQPAESSEPASRTVTVYYVDDLSAVVVGKKMDVTDEYDIWNALKDYGILTDGCELQSMEINEADQTMVLDFNEATADRINSMGTTGETEITGCIINTYLEAYGCKGVRLTVNGQAFVSSHGADFGKYTARVVFE